MVVSGAGWSSNGDGSSFLSGGTYGTSNYNGDGGFGGGGGSEHHPGGGGGGYHGGNCGGITSQLAIQMDANNYDNGRGGFSYNAGSNGMGASSSNSDHGYVVIDKL